MKYLGELSSYGFKFQTVKVNHHQLPRDLREILAVAAAPNVLFEPGNTSGAHSRTFCWPHEEASAMQLDPSVAESKICCQRTSTDNIGADEKIGVNRANLGHHASLNVAVKRVNPRMIGNRIVERERLIRLEVLCQNTATEILATTESEFPPPTNPFAFTGINLPAPRPVPLRSFDPAWSATLVLNA